MFIIRFLVYTNLLISCCAGTIVYGFVNYLGVPNEWHYFVCVFGATLFIYSFQRIIRLRGFKNSSSKRHIWLQKNKFFIYAFAFSGLVLAALFYLLFFFSISSFIFLSIIGFCSLLYPLRLKKNLPTLRELPFLKIHIIALSWTLVCLVWPLFYNQTSFIASYFIIFIANYLFFIAITIPFDIRDLPFDLPNQKTIPQLYGIKKSKMIAFLLLSISFVLLAYVELGFLFNPLFYTTYFGNAFLLFYIKSNTSELVFSGVLDGWLMLYGLMWLAL